MASDKKETGIEVRGGAKCGAASVRMAHLMPAACLFEAGMAGPAEAIISLSRGPSERATAIRS